MRVTAIYNKANDMQYLKDLSEKLDIEVDERI